MQSDVSWQFKWLALAADLFFAFFNFTLAIRHFNHVSFLIHLTPETDEIVTHEMIVRSINDGFLHNSFGMRCYYFTIPLVLWLFSPLFLCCRLGSADRGAVYSRPQHLMKKPMNSKRFLYFTDPLCGWCFGMGPVIERILEDYSSHFSFEIHHYGLCPGERALTVSPDLLDGFRSEVKRIETRTGAKITPKFWNLLQKEGFRYDSLPATQAALAVRSIDPSRELAFVHEMQRRLFTQGDDPRDENRLAEAVEAVGVDTNLWRERWQTPEIAEKTESDFDLADDLGLEIVPSLLFFGNEKPTRLCAGFTPYEDLKARIDTALETSNLLKINEF